MTGFLDFSASHGDAASFLQRYFPKGRHKDFADATAGSNVRPNNENNATLEGNLDTQIALSVGYHSAVTYLMVGPNNQAQPNQYFGDQLISFGGDTVVGADVLSMFGLAAQGQLLALVEAILSGDGTVASVN